MRLYRPIKSTTFILNYPSSAPLAHYIYFGLAQDNHDVLMLDRTCDLARNHKRILASIQRRAACIIMLTGNMLQASDEIADLLADQLEAVIETDCTLIGVGFATDAQSQQRDRGFFPGARRKLQLIRQVHTFIEIDPIVPDDGVQALRDVLCDIQFDPREKPGTRTWFEVAQKDLLAQYDRPTEPQLLADRFFGEGMWLMHAEMWSTAITYFKYTLNYNPDHDTVRHYLAEARKQFVESKHRKPRTYIDDVPF